jgi:hypothetical protein
MSRAGLPTAVVWGGTSVKTTEHAPILAPEESKGGELREGKFAEPATWLSGVALEKLSSNCKCCRIHSRPHLTFAVNERFLIVKDRRSKMKLLESKAE